MPIESRRSLWGWNASARRLVGGLILLLALALGWCALPPRHPAPVPDPTLCVDPNTVPPAVLLALPRFGPVLVSRFVAERERRPFESLADIDARVRGVGPATIEAIRPYLRFDPVPPADAGKYNAPSASGE